MSWMHANCLICMNSHDFSIVLRGQTTSFLQGVITCTGAYTASDNALWKLLIWPRETYESSLFSENIEYRFTIYFYIAHSHFVHHRVVWFINHQITLQVLYYGLIEQSTSENWTNARLSLFTVNPSIGGSVPDLGVQLLKFKWVYVASKSSPFYSYASYDHESSLVACDDIAMYDPTIEDSYGGMAE